MNSRELTGRTRSHVIQIENPRFAAGDATVEAYLRMRESASDEGFDLVPFSAFRDFKSQLNIWNLKYSGKRPLFDREGVQKVHRSLSPSELVHSILSWSALPGGSRHHWGTEIDVIDRSAISEDYDVKLLPEEFQQGGVFYKMHCWLNENLNQFGFFRPYTGDRGGINPEPWHISFGPMSREAMADLDIKMIRDALLESRLMGKETVLEMLPEIFERYILNISDQAESEE